MRQVNRKPSWASLKEAIGAYLPKVKFAVAYGSAVFQQANVKAKSDGMIDLLLIVNNRQEFHQCNMELNREHYSGPSRWFGPRYIELINRWVFPIHFNSHITLNGSLVKYGVVDQQTFRQDISQWTLLTLAGRLHKPVWLLTFWDRLDHALLEQNLKMAVACALLLIGEPVFDEELLYTTITELSYLGDMRFTFRLQNKQKVVNIVRGNIQGFQQLYRPILEKYFEGHVTCSEGQIYYQETREFRTQLLGQLPRNIKLKMMDGSESAIESFEERYMLKSEEHFKTKLRKTIASVNRWSSLWMGWYHLLSSSWLKNLTYSLEKRAKARKK